MRKAIAMKCNKKQFEAVKEKLEKFSVESNQDLERLDYLTNNFGGNEYRIGFCGHWNKKANGRNCHETWNEKVFLEACGIESMRKPTLEEVKEYFKNALEIESVQTGRKENITGLIEEFDGEFYIVGGIHGAKVWHKGRGYAKILKTKTPSFTITKEQIRTIESDGCAYVKQWFPEVFKKELEVGKWYKDEGKFMFCFQGIYSREHVSKAYGFTRSGKWHENLGIGNDWEYKEATDQEVFEALKNEAVKRGLADGVYINIINNYPHEHLVDRITGKFDYEEVPGGRYEGKMALRDSDGNIIFINGQWATITPTITKEEAEEILGKKII